ncbi:hypothetical protein DPMN_181494 [Dreissena polymorpha]|uniref:Uncharacterized protein n=1 Tax=Dreissena polymorpha TaxID=45954 RepID=A0A9D4I5D2_DREPO|nr:hypothetical protein DPMN_181494 [Dreissena polymorpha]
MIDVELCGRVHRAAVYKKLRCAGKRKDFQMCAGSSSLAAGVNSRDFWSSNKMLEGVLADSDEDESRRGTLLRKFHMQKLNRISTAETQFIKSKIRVTGLHMEEDFHVCYSTLQKQVDVQMASSTDVFLGAAKHELWCTCSQRRRRLKKRNIAEKVNGTCKQDFTCRNGLIAVPTVNKDFICCETTQQKVYYQASIVNTYVWRTAATKPWVHRTDNLNIGPCMDISATL